MITRPVAVFSFALVTATITTPATAQWSSNPAQNLAIGDGIGEQVLPKIATTSDGGCYLGWFDSRTGTYAVYLQRLDPAGVEQWPHGGMLVSGNPQSTSLVDWDLICDSQDHCVLTFTDTRVGPDLDVYAYRIAPNGALLWGPNGVALSNNADYEPNPRVCEISGGLFAFTWSNTVTRTIQYQLLYPFGQPIYPGDGYAIAGETGATPGFCRIAAADVNAFIISWVRTITFTGNKHVHAQKFGAGGNPMWNGGTRVAVFDGGSVPIAHEPRLLHDGYGGAVFAWHFAAGNLFSCRVQHVTVTGAEIFAHNGVDVSNSANSKFDPAIVHRGLPTETFVAWNERNVGQTTWGIFAQKLDAVGAPQWGATGVPLLPINTTVKFAPVAAALGDGLAVAVLEESLGLSMKKVLAFGLDNAGAPVWSPATAACTVASDKLRLQIATTASGVSLLTWTDHRAGTPDVFAQSIELPGNVGITLATVSLYGCGGNPAGSLVTQGRPAFGSTMQLGITNPVATQAIGSLPVLVFGLAPAAGHPCGTPAPGYGMNGPAVPGELLLDLLAPTATLFGFASPWVGPGVPSMFPFAVPLTPWLMQVSLYAQGVLLDLSPGAPVPIGLTTAARLTIGS